MPKSVAASIREAAFDCPHCGAYTTQFWHSVSVRRLPDDNKLPHIPDEAERVKRRKRLTEKQDLDEKLRADMYAWLDAFSESQVALAKVSRDPYSNEAFNLFLTTCYHCSKVGIWVGERLIFPAQKVGVAPNEDLPVDIKADFDEAREIILASPRGACALLRLCIQKLCKHLGETGKDIDTDIASLVRKGLNPTVQRSLDIVRVVGNEAVHPGTIDLKDDPDTAQKLLRLVNSIADQMISHPKSVDELYGSLPSAKLDGIKQRDQPKP